MGYKTITFGFFVSLSKVHQFWMVEMPKVYLMFSFNSTSPPDFLSSSGTPNKFEHIFSGSRVKCLLFIIDSFSFFESSILCVSPFHSDTDVFAGWRKTSQVTASASLNQVTCCPPPSSSTSTTPLRKGSPRSWLFAASLAFFPDWNQGNQGTANLFPIFLIFIMIHAKFHPPIPLSHLSAKYISVTC